MDVYLLRHGKAEDRSANISSDAKRPLTASGAAEVREISRGISSLGICPHLIVSSPLTRAKETARIVSDQIKKKCRSAPHCTTWSELTPESDVVKTHARLSSMAKPNISVMLVGHQPHLSLFASSVVTSGRNLTTASKTGRYGGRRVRSDFDDCEPLAMALKKGGLVIMRCAMHDHTVCGSLRSLMTPKQLRLCGTGAE